MIRSSKKYIVKLHKYINKTKLEKYNIYNNKLVNNIVKL